MTPVYSPKAWEDEADLLGVLEGTATPTSDTPITAAALVDLETRVTDWAGARANHTGTQVASTISDFAEAVDDRVNTLLVAGPNITLDYNDVANTLTITGEAGGGSSFIDAISDTGTIDLTVTGTSLSGAVVAGSITETHIATTATPQVARLGLGVASSASAILAFGTTPTLAISDIQGDDVNANTGSTVTDLYAGRRVMITQGTNAAGVTEAVPTFKVVRTQEITGYNGTDSQSANSQRHAAIVGITRGAGLDDSMVVGVVGSAHQASTDTVASTDAAGIVGIGARHGVGASYGAYLEGRATVTGARTRGAEIACWHFEDTDHTYAPTSIGLCDQNGIQLSSRNTNSDDTPRLGGTAIAIYHIGDASQGARWDVGIGFLSQQGGAVATTSISDDSASLTSISIGGTHTTALRIASGAGSVLIGGGSTTTTSIANNGVIELARTSLNVLKVTSAIGDTNPKLAIKGSDGRLDWSSGAAATDVQLGRDAGGTGLKLTGTAANLQVGALTALATVSGVSFSVTGVTGGSTDGYIDLTEVGTIVAAPTANHARIFAQDDSTITALYARFPNNTRLIRKDIAAQTYSVTNFTDTRTYDQDTVTTAVLADVVGTLVKDLRAEGIVA